MVQADDVLRFWLDECGPSCWYAEDAALDARIREKFLNAWEGAREGQYSLWLTHATGTLAYIILTDQFSRNIHRGQREAFCTDRIALAAAKTAISKGWDMRVDEPARQFFYLPLMHSENLCDQDRCVRLMCERLPETGDSNLLHARTHREVIRLFGRFPTRNVALARASTKAEALHLEQGGYGSVLRSLQEKHAA
ncbi:MAG: DUF924 family protein [Paracoccaceae bacterium]